MSKPIFFISYINHSSQLQRTIIEGNTLTEAVEKITELKMLVYHSEISYDALIDERWFDIHRELFKDIMHESSFIQVLFKETSYPFGSFEEVKEQLTAFKDHYALILNAKDEPILEGDSLEEKIRKMTQRDGFNSRTIKMSPEYALLMCKRFERVYLKSTKEHVRLHIQREYEGNVDEREWFRLATRYLNYSLKEDLL